MTIESLFSLREKSIPESDSEFFSDSECKANKQILVSVEFLKASTALNTDRVRKLFLAWSQEKTCRLELFTPNINFY